MSEQNKNLQPKIIYENVEADNLASANADDAFNEGKWKEFTGEDLGPHFTELVVDDVPEVVVKKEVNMDSRYPDFYTPVEELEKLTEEQMKESTQIFNSLFDDLMLKDMDKVKKFESVKGRPTANLLNKIRVEGENYTIALRDSHIEDEQDNSQSIVFRDSEKIERDISLQRIVSGSGREYWSYRLGSDGIVRRWDGGDATAKRRKEEELGIDQEKKLGSGATLEEIGRYALAAIKNITEGLPNSRLEEDMGLNNQPVSPKEIEGLKEFLGNAEGVARH